MLMHESSPSELLDRAVFIHHADKEHSTLMGYVALKGLEPETGGDEWAGLP